MKKKFLMLLTMLSAVIGTYADNTLTATGSIAKASGSMGTLSVSLTNDVDIKGVQFNLTLPAGISVESYNTTTRATGFLASYSAGDGMVTLNTQDATIAVGEGEILTFTIKANQDLTAGTQTSTMTGVVLSWGGAKEEQLEIPTINYDLEITDGIILDENSTVLPAAQSSVDVTVNRTLKAGVWNTICLPFAMTKAKVETAFGTGTTLCQFSSCTTIDNVTTLEFTDKSNKIITANTPFLIKPDNDVTSFTVSSVNINPIESNAVAEVFDELEENVIAKFIGTLRAGTTIPADYIFLGAGDNKFYYSDGSNTIKGFRGYFYLKDFKSSDASRQIKLMVDGEEATGIEGLYINGEAVAEGVYNLKGQRVDMPTKKGVYIKDGKKVVIK